MTPIRVINMQNLVILSMATFHFRQIRLATSLRDLIRQYGKKPAKHMTLPPPLPSQKRRSVHISDTSLTSALGSLSLDNGAKREGMGGQMSADGIAITKREVAITHLMTWSTNWLNHKFEGWAHQKAHDSSKHQTSVKPGALQSQITAEARRGQKHPRNQSDNEMSDEDGDDPPQKGRKLSKVGQGPAPRYACPFSKYNPTKYQTAEWSLCCWPGWTSVHRVKEHLYRNHLLPKFQCSRCRRVLESAGDLTAHLRETVICDIVLQEPQDGISEEQEKSLRAREKNRGRASARWRKVYEILFPGECPIPSPFVDFGPINPEIKAQTDDFFRQFEACAREQFPRVLHPVLDNMIGRIHQSSISREEILEAVEGSIMLIMENFRLLDRSRFHQDQPLIVPPVEDGVALSIDEYALFSDLLTEQPGSPYLDVGQLMENLGNGNEPDSGYVSRETEVGSASQDPESS
ncbi:hypothetical protein BGZ61DRAFT_209902 [Ilyonectria robusta]|uniref:uncharacterized protein n=1 Tax=Ilyonectria robusta TaxID=1079257 RepID=UPI001E8DB11D|nr:uncharacterized protein BGZ61DRAFT_209902 [Ilyonectria robusta]KAH8714335.1 hypothetical protein BGZ61DRAFT_209902 [Ilyonectria robusta]